MDNKNIIMYKTFSFVLFLILFCFSALYSEDNDRYLEDVDYDITIGTALNDTDLGINVFTARKTPLFQRNNHNYNLDGEQIRKDDFIYNQTLTSGFSYGQVDLFFKYDIDLGISFRNTFSEDLTFNSLEIKNIELSTLSFGDGLLLAKIGYLHPYFSEYVLDMRKELIEDDDSYFIHNLDYGKKNIKGVQFELPIGRFLKSKFNKDIGDLRITGVAGKAESSNDETEYPNGGQYNKVYYLSRNPPAVDPVIVLSVKPGQKEIKEDYAYNSINPRTPETGHFSYYLNVRVMDENDNNLNTIPSLPLVEMGKVTDRNLSKYVQLEDTRVVIHRELFLDYDFVFNRATKIVIEWFEDDPRSRQTLYLNCINLSYIFPKFPYLKLNLSYVNLHNDKNSTIYTQKYIPPILLDISSFRIDFDYKDRFLIKSELNYSRYNYNEKLGHKSEVSDIMYYSLFTWKEKLDRQNNLRVEANYRNIGKNYALGIADLRFVRYLVDDADDNGQFDFEDKYFEVGEYGGGTKVSFSQKETFGFRFLIDYQQNLKSNYIYYRPNLIESIFYPRGTLDEVETYRYLPSFHFFLTTYFKSEWKYLLKTHQNGYNRKWSSLLIKNTLFPKSRNYSIELSIKHPIKYNSLNINELENYEKMISITSKTKNFEFLPLKIDKKGLFLNSMIDLKYYFSHDWRYNVERNFMVPIYETSSGDKNYIDLNRQKIQKYSGNLKLFTYIKRLKPFVGYGLSYYFGRDSVYKQSVDYNYWFYEIGAEYIIDDFLSVWLKYYEREVTFSDSGMHKEHGYKYKSIMGIMKMNF